MTLLERVEHASILASKQTSLIGKITQAIYAAFTSQQDVIVRAFKGLTTGTKYISNDKGTDRYHNYINGDNADKEDPKMAPLICCDDWVRVIETRTNSNGVVMARLDRFSPNDGFPLVTRELLSDPRILWATIIKDDGTIANFPQLGGLPVPYPYIASESWWYPLKDLAKV